MACRLLVGVESRKIVREELVEGRGGAVHPTAALRQDNAGGRVDVEVMELERNFHSGVGAEAAARRRPFDKGLRRRPPLFVGEFRTAQVAELLVFVAKILAVQMKSEGDLPLHPRDVEIKIAALHFGPCFQRGRGSVDETKKVFLAELRLAADEFMWIGGDGKVAFIFDRAEQPAMFGREPENVFRLRFPDAHAVGH